MSERNLNSKRESRDFEASSTIVSVSVSPLKKKTKLDDSSASDSHGVVLAVPSPYVASSAESSRASIVSSDCFSSESNETVRNNPTSVVDLEVKFLESVSSFSILLFSLRLFLVFVQDTVSEALGETTETASSSAIKRDEPPEVSKVPTAEEIESFLSELEGGDDKQKRFIEKYNFDILNDKPLQGRYMWDRLKP
ncbi:unnamed protein product [Eruca vesicaria subsp. sativa]|uniref:Cyclin-dependent kinase inhibitor n=1 Tax=Eruca vesicaria subsp. sativa TaxID=29727 RepID=A0ABC8L388_ERUVS|nr:unnamed protein product [Eruca vesicaria subsp. sativa]